ncbi:MAG TPA: M20/M25/M40 family metallo-hydrolase [Thermoanaerobaculia bacterium]|nr:M20/M25/M40 family metallo-hydrolase [Thermoanaerobaculia bacterium]
MLDRRRRQAARLALYGSLVLVLGATVALVQIVRRPPQLTKVEQDWLKRDYRSLPEVKLLQEYVRIDTSETTGDEIAGARFLKQQLDAAGIPAEIEIVGEKKANLYATLEGKDPRPLVLHNHIDVEPVDPKEWTHPPFEGRIELPWIHGRGTFDMKSVAIAQLLAMIELKKSGVPLKRSVLFLATSSEERGSRLGVRRILQTRPDFVRSFWAVLTEGGVVEARARDNIKFWGTEVAQRRYVDLIVKSPDKEKLEELRERVRSWAPLVAESEPRLTPEVATVLKAYASTRDREDLRRLVGNPEKTVADPAEFKKLPPYLQSMLKNEAVAFPVREAPEGGYQLTIKFQLLPGVELADVREDLVPDRMLQGFSVTVDEPPSARHGSPMNHEVFQAIEQTIRETYPGTPVGPYFLATTATDSRFFRAAGAPSYGFSPFLIMNTDTFQVDRANERFGLPGFVEGVEVYKKLVRRLVSDT